MHFVSGPMKGTDPRNRIRRRAVMPMCSGASWQKFAVTESVVDTSEAESVDARPAEAGSGRKRPPPARTGSVGSRSSGDCEQQGLGGAPAAVASATCISRPKTVQEIESGRNRHPWWWASKGPQAKADREGTSWPFSVLCRGRTDQPTRREGGEEHESNCSFFLQQETWCSAG